MELLILFGVGLSTGLSGAMIPGPLTLYTISEALRKGHLVGLKIAAGHLLLEAVFVVFVVLGLRDWLASPGFRAAVSWVGGLGLVAMGALILGQVRRLSLVRQADVVFHGGPLAGGAFFSLTSPGFLLWWATIGAAVFLQGALAGTGGLTMVAAGHALADLGWCWLVAFAVERGKRLVTDRAYRLIMAGIAVCLIVLGLSPICSLTTIRKFATTSYETIHLRMAVGIPLGAPRHPTTCVASPAATPGVRPSSGLVSGGRTPGLRPTNRLWDHPDRAHVRSV